MRKKQLLLIRSRDPIDGFSLVDSMGHCSFLVCGQKYLSHWTCTLDGSSSSPSPPHSPPPKTNKLLVRILMDVIYFCSFSVSEDRQTQRVKEEKSFQEGPSLLEYLLNSI